MKIAIILSDNVYVTPYLTFYINILEKAGIDYIVIYWDKSNSESISDNRYFRFTFNNSGKFARAAGYFAFRQVILNLLKAKKIDFIISLHSQVAALLVDKLVCNYKHRYIYDIRDYSYEKFYAFRMIQRKLVKHSCLNIISSLGYKSFLPNATYWVCNNVPPLLDPNYKQYENWNDEKIVISYIGSIRFMEQNKKIIRFFKNDARFHLNFIGRNALKLKNFCEQNDIQNITLIDEFKSADTLKFYLKTDMIMNLYGNHDPLLDYALSNKLYYAAYLYKPILVCKDTYMERITNQFKLGMSLSLDDEKERDDLYNYYKNLNRKKFIYTCDAFWRTIEMENEKLRRKIFSELVKSKR